MKVYQARWWPPALEVRIGPLFVQANLWQVPLPRIRWTWLDNDTGWISLEVSAGGRAEPIVGLDIDVPAGRWRDGWRHWADRHLYRPRG